MTEGSEMRPKVSIIGQEADTVRIERPDGKAVDCFWRSDGRFVVYDMPTHRILAEVEVGLPEQDAPSAPERADTGRGMSQEASEMRWRKVAGTRFLGEEI